MPKEDIKDHGLMNQGATCYLNSVLQVLFMTKDFREAVERHPNKDPECIEYHLTNLFTQYPNSLLKITQNLGINNVYEQRDAAEYFEKIFSLMSHDASQIFHGELTHTNKCSACGRDDDTDDPFWHLPLALVDSSNENYSVVDGIEKFFSSSEVSGKNQMYCDECDDKADATLKSVMKHHPDVLMLLLKRFEFDYHYMAYVKINCVVDVPLILQIPENQTYELYAVVNHSGDLRSGHYTATIKPDDDDSWYNFNDARVSKLDEQPFQVDNTEESENAYLLFYKKKKMDAAGTCTQDIREMSTPECSPPDISDNDKQHQDVVKIREKQKGEEVEVSNDTAEAVSTYRYEEKESRDMGRFESRGVEMMRDHSEDMGRNTGANDQAERKEGLTVETDQNVDNQNSDNDAQKRPHDDFVRDEQSEKKRHSSTKYFTKDVMENGQEVEEKREINVGGDKEGKTGDVKLTSRTGKLLTIYDLCKDQLDQNKRGGSDAKLNMPKVDQGCEQGISNMLYESPEQQKEVTGGIAQKRLGDEYRRGTSMTKYDSEEDVEGQDNERLAYVRHENQERKQKSRQDYGHECVGVVRQGDEEVIIKVNKDKRQEEKRDGKGDKKQKRDDKHIQSRGTSVHYCSEGVEDQNFRRLDDDRQNRRQERQEQESRYKDVIVGRLTREEKTKEYNEHIQNREDLFLARGELAGSKRLTENQRQQIRSCDQHKRQGVTQPDVKSGSHSVIENMTEGREHPKEEKVKRTDSDGQSRTSRDETMKTEMVDETSRGSKKSRKFERNSRTDTLAKHVHSLSLNESSEPEKYKTKEFARERKWWRVKRPLKSEDRKKKKKRKKALLCVPTCISSKNRDQLSD